MKPKLSEQQVKEIDAAMMRLKDDPQPVLLEIDKGSALCLLATIQLACRHPNYRGPTRKLCVGIANAIGNALIQDNPGMRLIIELGWNPEADIHKGCPEHQ